MNTIRDQRWSAAEVSRLITLLNGERHYLEIIFEALPVAVAIVTSDLNIRAANAAFSTLFGLETQNGAAGTPLIRATGDRQSPASVLNAIERGDRSVAIGKHSFLCSRIPASDDIVLVQSSAVAEPKPEPPVQPVTVRIPLSENERMEERMAAAAQLAGGLSHELNNILTIITSYSHLVIEQLDSAGLPTGDMDVILKAAADASQIGMQLVHIGGRHVSLEGSVDLNAVVGGIEPALRQLCGDRIHLEVERKPNLPRVAGDRTQVETAIRALVEHSIDAVADGGTVVIRTRPSADLGSVEIGIQDTRKWPDGAVGRRLFEPYVTYPGSRKSEGLKLAAAYSIIRRCGGEVSVTTAADRTVIVVRLPARALESSSNSAETATSTPGVLLVDDKADVRSAVRQMVERHGYRVLEAPTPQAALRMLEEQSSRIDILLSDIDMPGMNGRELARRARSMRPALSVVLMSGYADETMVLNGPEERGIVFLQKPFSPDRLFTALQGVLQRG